MDSQPADANHHRAIEHRLVWLTRLLGAGVLALVAVTWKLWTPQDVFPRVPLFRWAPPDWWDWVSLALIIAGGVGLLIRPPRDVRPLAATLALGLAIAFVCDQHRLQPWAWQFFILALLIALADDALLWTGWQWLTISIYFYSALSKFDAGFLHTMGGSLMRELSLSLQQSRLPLQVRYDLYPLCKYSTLVFPIGELALAICLAFSRTRRLGWVSAVFMHIALLRILGPSGLRHSWGVILWNVYFLFQALVLFAWPDLPWLWQRWLTGGSNRSSTAETPSTALLDERLPLVRIGRWSNTVAQGVLGIALFLPSTWTWGLCDTWLGWAVYVKPQEDAWLKIETPIIQEMTDDELTAMGVYRPRGVFKNMPSKAWTVDIGGWSLRELHAPTYPSLRFTLGIALDLSERLETDEISARFVHTNRFRINSIPSPFKLQSAHEIHAYAGRFWFNAYPTSMYRRAAQGEIDE